MGVTKAEKWKNSDVRVFWAELAPCDHLVQIYENDEILHETLYTFVETGLKEGDSVIVIALESTLRHLDMKLRTNGFGVDSLRSFDQYIPLSAEKVLSQFMVGDWPDEELFMEVISKVVHRAQNGERKTIRAYGEMVAILWEQGNSGATVRLEHLWNKFCATEKLCLFCAYPKSGFTQHPYDSLEQICCTHSKQLAGDRSSTKEVYYKQTSIKKVV